MPVKKAFEWGCDRVVLLLTKPRDVRRTSQGDDKLVPLLKRKYPAAAQGLHLRAKRYNESVDYTEKLVDEGRALIVAPKDTFGVDTLTKDKKAMKRLYEAGLSDAQEIYDWVSALRFDEDSSIPLA